MKKTLLMLIIGTFAYAQEAIVHVIVTSDTHTFSEADLAAFRPHIFTEQNSTAIMPKTSLETFTLLSIKLLSDNSTLTIIPADGVSLGSEINQKIVFDNSGLVNGGDAISLYSYEDDEWGVWKGNASITYSSYASPIQNEYVQSNAAGDDSGTTAGFSLNSQISLSSIPSTDIALGDDFAIRMVLNQDNDNIMSNKIYNLTQGHQYKAVIRCRQPQGSSNGFFNWNGVTNAAYPGTVISEQWEEKVITFTPNSEIVTIKTYVGTNSNLTGDSIEISSIVITDITN
jgi:hypothetical protein